MRLLECRSDGGFSLTKDLSTNENLEYAIFSHTWGADTEEVTFKDLVDGTGVGKAGYDQSKPPLSRRPRMELAVLKT